MPNTLAHLGVQSLVSKAVFRPVDIKWIGLGCLVPDLPWMAQRLVHPLGLVDPIDLRLYVIVQASLLYSLLLSAAISLQVRNSGRIFLVLAANVLLHLLLDPTQTKWANGTHLLAPLSWHLLHFNWYWPEDLPSQLMTFAGALLFPYFAWKDRRQDIAFTCSHRRRIGGGMLLIIYLLSPVLLLSGPLGANNHFTAVMAHHFRSGAAIEIDRKTYRARDHTIVNLSDEQLQLRGAVPSYDARLSLQGRFIDNNTILVSKYHVHSPLRDIYSLIGCSMVLLSWLLALLDKQSTIRRPKRDPSNHNTP